MGLERKWKMFAMPSPYTGVYRKWPLLHSKQVLCEQPSSFSPCALCGGLGTGTVTSRKPGADGDCGGERPREMRMSGSDLARRKSMAGVWMLLEAAA